MDSNKQARTGHRQRVKQKILKNGLDGFLEYEILEALLFYVIPRRDTKNIAKELLEVFGSLEGVLNADENKLKSLKIKGISQSSFIFFKLLHDLNKIMYQDNFKMHVEGIGGKKGELLLNSVETTYKYLKSDMGLLEKEVFKVIFLNSQNKYLGEETIFYGTIDKSVIYPREILKEAMRYNAKSIIISHNHPSKNPKPSQADIEMTKKIKKILEPVEVLVLDHIIITSESYFSFLEEGLI